MTGFKPNLFRIQIWQSWYLNSRYTRAVHSRVWERVLQIFKGCQFKKIQISSLVCKKTTNVQLARGGRVKMCGVLHTFTKFTVFTPLLCVLLWFWMWSGLSKSVNLLKEKYKYPVGYVTKYTCSACVWGAR